MIMMVAESLRHAVRNVFESRHNVVVVRPSPANKHLSWLRTNRGRSHWEYLDARLRSYRDR